MAPEEAYALYVSVKTHFASEAYRFHQGDWRRRAGSFSKRKDSAMFFWLAKHPRPEDLLVSSFAWRRDVYVADLRCDEAERRMESYVKRKDSLVYTFTEDVKQVTDLWSALRPSPDGRRPLLLRAMASNIMHPVTSCALDAASDCVESWVQTVKDPVILPDLRLRLLKLRPFLGLDGITNTDLLDQVRAALLEVVESQ